MEMREKARELPCLEYLFLAELLAITRYTDHHSSPSRGAKSYVYDLSVLNQYNICVYFPLR